MESFFLGGVDFKCIKPLTIKIRVVNDSIEKIIASIWLNSLINLSENNIPMSFNDCKKIYNGFEYDDLYLTKKDLTLRIHFQANYDGYNVIVYGNGSTIINLVSIIDHRFPEFSGWNLLIDYSDLEKIKNVITKYPSIIDGYLVKY